MKKKELFSPEIIFDFDFSPEIIFDFDSTFWISLFIIFVWVFMIFFQKTLDIDTKNINDVGTIVYLTVGYLIGSAKRSGLYE